MSIADWVAMAVIYFLGYWHGNSDIETVIVKDGCPVEYSRLAPTPRPPELPPADEMKKLDPYMALPPWKAAWDSCNKDKAVVLNVIKDYNAEIIEEAKHE